MLVISRRLGQKVVIDGQVWITVTALTDNRVEIGFEAPREIDVDREEIYLRKMAQVQRRGAKTNETQENTARRLDMDAPRVPAKPQKEVPARLVSEMRREPREEQRAAPRIEYRRRRRG